MEQFQGAVVKEQGVTFGIVVVQRHVLDNSAEAAKAQRFGRRAFGPMPIVLMGQDSNGVATYYGRPDIARFLASVRMGRIPWQEYTLN